MDAILGFDRVPVTFEVRCQNTSENGDKVEKEGVVQAFLPNSAPLCDVLFKKEGGKALKAIDQSHCHICSDWNDQRSCC